MAGEISVAAAGATLEEGSFPAFQDGFGAVSERAIARDGQAPSVDIDLELPFATIRPELVEELERLAPHGEANPTALFCTRGVAVCGRPKRMGKDRSHIAFHVRHGERTFRAFGPGMADRYDMLCTKGTRVDLAYRLKFDAYRAPGSIELEILDIVPHSGDAGPS